MKQPDLYELIDSFATAVQVRDLLRRYKADHRTEIHLSGTKEHLLTDLRRAVDGGIIPQKEVFDLLRETEENGSQHILYHRPVNAEVVARLRDADGVARTLFGRGWERRMGFPRLTLVPDGYDWGDFRHGLPRKPNDWIAKLYGHESGWKFVEERKEAAKRLVRVYEYDEERIVGLVRWNDPDLLEVRVSRCDSRKLLDARLNVLRNRIRQVVHPSEIPDFPLDVIRRNMLDRRHDNAAVYEVGTTMLIDEESGVARFLPHDGQEALDQSAARRQAVDAYRPPLALRVAGFPDFRRISTCARVGRDLSIPQ